MNNKDKNVDRARIQNGFGSREPPSMKKALRAKCAPMWRRHDCNTHWCFCWTPWKRILSVSAHVGNSGDSLNVGIETWQATVGGGWPALATPRGADAASTSSISPVLT